MNQEYIRGWVEAMNDMENFGKEIVYAAAKDLEFPTDYNRGYRGYLRYGKQGEKHGR